MANQFNFPMDLSPKTYSGMGPEHKGMLSSLLPGAQKTFEQFPQQREQFYNQSRGDITKGYDTAIGGLGKTYERAIQPAMQQVLNNMAKRGMLSSQITGETMAGTARGIGESIIDRQSSLELAKQLGLGGLAQQEGQGMYQYPQLLTNLLSQGQYSESTDEGVPYRAALNFLQSLMT